MPILECDPWREQYFERVVCPADVVVPTDDPESWRLYPAHRWVFNKLLICATQGLDHGPHGVPPPQYPVFSKPVYNLRGMGAGSRVIHSSAEYAACHTPGHMWMTLLEGEHLSTDAAVVDGIAGWWRHARGLPTDRGTFDYWEVTAKSHAGLEQRLGAWLHQHLRGYTGMVNLETIGGRIIECHLRFSDQWPDLYGGDRWVSAVVDLYTRGAWRYEDSQRRDGFSVVLWGAHDQPYSAPDARALDRIRAMRDVSSVQVTFDPAKAHSAHAMPPGGFRLAVINAWDLKAGMAARERLREAILG